MAARELQEINSSKLILSAYGESLKINTNRRYVEKISVIGMAPFIIPK